MPIRQGYELESFTAPFEASPINKLPFEGGRCRYRCWRCQGTGFVVNREAAKAQREERAQREREVTAKAKNKANGGENQNVAEENASLKQNSNESISPADENENNQNFVETIVEEGAAMLGLAADFNASGTSGSGEKRPEAEIVSGEDPKASNQAEENNVNDEKTEKSEETKPEKREKVPTVVCPLCKGSLLLKQNFVRCASCGGKGIGMSGHRYLSNDFGRKTNLEQLSRGRQDHFSHDHEKCHFLCHCWVAVLREPCLMKHIPRAELVHSIKSVRDLEKVCDALELEAVTAVCQFCDGAGGREA